MAVCFFLVGTTAAQEESSILPRHRNGTVREGQIFIHWGYNRAYYNQSDIHFKGDGYDFTLHEARADDMPEEWNPKVYLSPTQFTVPQSNFRAGYYFHDNWGVSAGWDHMKYQLIQTQLLRISGYIDEEKYFDPEYTGTFNNDNILYTHRFMDYHHSDGFNFIRVALDRRQPIWSSLNLKHELVFNGSLSAGAMMPWTDFTFFGEKHRNWPHFAGYGASLNMGMRFEFFRWFFLQANAQMGWSNLKDIILEESAASRAEQKITFFERSFALGGYIPVKKKTGRNEVGSK
ncbi:MAG: hypothetical protein SH856_03055 [Flavobacteriales bacterium]|nr:hypothetical protein [Flavobacteriales bacterium]